MGSVLVWDLKRTPTLEIYPNVPSHGSYALGKGEGGFQGLRSDSPLRDPIVLGFMVQALAPSFKFPR